MNIKKTLITMVLTAMAAAGWSQNGFNLPYSQFGLGQGDQPFNVPSVARMGGSAATTASGNHINPFNPASYGVIGMESFIFDMGLGIDVSQLCDRNNSQRDADGNINYLMIGMPLTRWWKLAAGLMPYSTVDYESVSEQSTPQSPVRTVYDGSGGVSQLFLGMAFNIPAGQGRSLNVGANLNYLTGTIQRAISFTFPGNDSTYFLNSRKMKTTKVGNLFVDLGLQFSQALGQDYTLGLGLTYRPRIDSHVTDEALIYTYHVVSTTSEPLVDTIFPLAGQGNRFESLLEQASTFGVGLSIERNGLWRVAADAVFAPWRDIRYTDAYDIFGHSTLASGAYSRLALGVEKIGNMDASSYWGRMTWSVGANTERGVMYLNLDGNTNRIDAWGLGAGVSLPMRKGKSALDLSVGYRSLGDPDLLQRRCLSFGIAVSSCERWFVKRKYN